MFREAKGDITMTKTLEPTLDEIKEEAVITKRMLDRVPADKLTWKPHPKSMSLGQLALHIAGIPGGLTKLLQMEEFDTAQANFNAPQPKNVAEIQAAHDQSVRAAEDFVGGMSDQTAQANWRLLAHGQQISSKPRITVLRSIMLNHWYHHRGQLSVYLRLLDVPVPVTYGPSADENPFG
jgi:uncharacterized damage-inducible protein DinB